MKKPLPDSFGILFAYLKDISGQEPTGQLRELTIHTFRKVTVHNEETLSIHLSIPTACYFLVRGKEMFPEKSLTLGDGGSQDYFMNAKIPPIIVLLISGAFMWLIAKYLPQFSFRLSYNTLLFWLILLTGFMLLVSGVRVIFRHGTTVHPDHDSLSKATALVTAGIYKYTRNPIYLGMAVMLLAWMIFLENWLSVAGVIIFIGFINRYQVIPEEKALEELFGEEYARYKKRVRRWI